MGVNSLERKLFAFLVRPCLVGSASICVSVLSSPQLAIAQETLSCIQVDQVDILNVQLFEASIVDSWVASFEGRCLGIGQFNEIMETVTEAYIDGGFLTSRAYLPEQNLADGSLEIAVVEGRIEKVNFNGEENRKWQRVVYPNLEGEVAQLRTIEQGLDVIRSMDSYTAEMELEAGEEVGASILNIKAVSEKPWAVNYSTNNYSQEPMGDYSTTVGVRYDHLLGINDQWSLSYTKSMSPNPLSFGYDGFGSESIAASVILPFGKWENSFSYSWSEYYQEIDGTFDPIPVDGWSESYSLGFKRLMFRDQTKKTYLELSLNRSENRNYILDTLIESSSRVISTAKLELSHEQPIWGGNFSGTIGIEKGIKAWGAEDYDTQPEDQPNAQFTRATFSGSWEREWQKEHGTIGYEATFSGQYSDDRLYGAQQFSIGGVSTVRGVMSAVATGSSGIFLRQEVSFAVSKFNNKYLGTPEIYVGLDHGRVFDQSDIDVDFWQATGGALGLRLDAGDQFTFDVSYGRLLCAGCLSDLDEYEPSGEWMMALSTEF